MIESPFSLFRQFESQLFVAILDKKDDVTSDEQVVSIISPAAPLPIASLLQKHEARAVLIRKPTNRSEEADGILTDKANLILSTRWADCQNFIVYSPSHHVVGVMHVGWRGLMAGMIPSLLQKMKNEWHIDPSEILVGAGPSLCKHCAEFSDPKAELPSIHPRYVDGRHIDLQQIATDELISLGVKPENFQRILGCTKCHPHLWWTYRGGHQSEVKQGHTNQLVCYLKR